MRHTSMFTARRAVPMVLGASVLSASLLARSLVAPETHATIGGCQSDPIVTLSNGVTLELSTVVDDTTTDVQQVSYTLHAPAGTWVTGEVNTSVLGVKDTFIFYADEPPNTYSAAVQVNTGASQIPVVAATDLVSVNGTLASTAQVSGQSPQTLWMYVSG